MPDPKPEVLQFLKTRRSRPAKMLKAPVPDHDAVAEMLAIAARSPDHGKLEPWRFIVLEKPALDRLAALVLKLGDPTKVPPRTLEKTHSQFADADLAVAVISAPVADEKVPRIDQTMSAGAVCLALLNTALASGWGACWLTGWMAADRGFLTEGLGLAEGEFVAGFIHIGTETFTPPERPRPDVAALTTWVSE